MPEFENLAPYEQPDAPKGKRILPVAPHVSPGGEFRPTRRDNRRRDEPILRPKKVQVPDLLETSEMERAFRQADKAQRVEDAAKGIKRPGPFARWWREFIKGLRKKLGLKKKPAKKKRAKRGGRDQRKPNRNDKRPSEGKGGQRSGRGRGPRDGGKGGHPRGGRPDARSGKGQNQGKPAAKKQARGGDQPKARKQARKRPPPERREKRDEKPPKPKPSAEAGPKTSKLPMQSTTPKAEVNGQTRPPRKRRNRNRGGGGNRPSGPGRED